MGLNWRRVGFAGLVLGAGLTALRRPAPPDTLPIEIPEREQQIRVLTQKLSDARVRWSALAERDAVLAAVDSLRAGAPPFLMLRGFAVGTRAPGTEAELARLWARIGTADSGVAVGVLGYDAKGYDSRGWGDIYRGTLITRGETPQRCAAVLPADRHPSGRVMLGQDLLRRALGPCALLAAFGLPGPGVRAWLERTQYSAARSTDWLIRPREFVEAGGDGPWGWLFDYSVPGGADRGFSLARTLGAEALAQLLAPPYHYGAPGLRCITGHAAACTEAVLQEYPALTAPSGWPADLTLSRDFARASSVTLASIRPLSGQFLSDLIRLEGRNRFARFWRSPLAVEPSFLEVYGEPLGAWSARWARNAWEATWEARYESSTLILGVNHELRWLGSTAAWTLLVLGIAARSARRRQAI